MNGPSIVSSEDAPSNCQLSCDCTANQIVKRSVDYVPEGTLRVTVQVP
jgi:hypothetical protein